MNYLDTLISLNIALFTLDFAGSGLSEGELISLSKYEVEDIRIAVKYLKSLKNITKIGIWGRSMGAVTALFYALEDSSI